MPPPVARPERPEDPLALVGGDPGPGVGRPTRDLPFAACEREVDPAPVRRPAERVREQVGDDLEHPVAVRDDHRAAVELLAVVDLAAAGLLGEGRVGARRVGPMSTSSWRTREPMRVQLARGRGRRRRAARAASSRRSATSIDSWRVSSSCDDPLAERLDVPADRGQRRAQLVGDGHQEAPLALVRLARAAPVIWRKRSARWPISPPPGRRDLDVALTAAPRRRPSRERAPASVIRRDRYQSSARDDEPAEERDREPLDQASASAPAARTSASRRRARRTSPLDLIGTRDGEVVAVGPGRRELEARQGPLSRPSAEESTACVRRPQLWPGKIVDTGCRTARSPVACSRFLGRSRRARPAVSP